MRISKNTNQFSIRPIQCIFFFAAVIVGIGCFIWASITSGNQAELYSDQTALYHLLSTVTADEVDEAVATNWVGDQKEKVFLADISLDQLVSLLHSISKNEITDGNGFPASGEISVFLKVETQEYLLVFADEIIYFRFDEETASLYGNRQWQTKNAELSAFLIDLFADNEKTNN